MIKRISILIIFIFVFGLVSLASFSSVSASEEKIVLFAMDDFQVWWLEDIQESIVQKHIDNNIPVTLGVIPVGITDPWGAGDRIIERMQRWDSYSFIEVAEHGYDHEVYFEEMSYSAQYNDIKKGKDLMNGIGVFPNSFIPPFGSADANTVLVLENLGFHTLYNPIEMSPTSDDDLLIIQDQLLLCKNEDEGKYCVYKDYNTIKQQIDQKIQQHGVALVLYHMQDFESSTGDFDNNKANQIVNYANQLKQDGYTLMTVEQYYQHISSPQVTDNDGDGYDINEDCDDTDPNVWQYLQGYLDNDNDDYGAGSLLDICSGAVLSTDYSNNNLDCDDDNANIHPGETDVCDGVDNDCDGEVDEGCVVEPYCGDAVCNGDETCLTCEEDCGTCPVEPVCGNGALEETEECDDEDNNGQVCIPDYGSSCNYCSNSCEIIVVQGAYCGDGIIQLGNEQCDDGNVFDGDGCSSLCEPENLEIKTLILYPNGQGYRREWQNVNCGRRFNEWKCIDEPNFNTYDYLKNSGTAKETFTFSDTDLSGQSVTINSITIFYYAMWNNYQSNSCFEAMIRSRGRDYLSGQQMCVGSSWEYVSHTYTENPATNLPWTVAEVDALEAGMHAVNPNGGGRVSQVYAVVEYI